MAKTPKKSLGVFSLVMINIIAVDNLRTLPFSAKYGTALISFYALAALVFFIPIALVSAELATGWPDRGGLYVWIREAFGRRMGFVLIWLQWVYNVIWYPTILSFVATTLAYLIDPQLAHNKYYVLSLVLILFWGATGINFYGMRVASILSTLGALIGTLLPMGLLIGLGWVWWHSGRPRHIDVSLHALRPPLSLQHWVFFLTILFGLVGIEMSATHADDVKDPGRSYPLALFWSTIIIMGTLILSSLAVALIVPAKDLSVMTGITQAYQLFFAQYKLDWLSPIMSLLIIFGGITSVAAWIIGPTKGLLIAVQDGSAPAYFGKTNSQGVPAVILLLQAALFTLLSSLFLLMPNVGSAYWLLSDITAQLAMLIYIGLFAAAWVLRRKQPNVPRAYRIPGGLCCLGLICGLGMTTCAGAIVLGFTPPAQLFVGRHWLYELILIIGMLGLCLPPFLLAKP